ncbi:MAG TPA: hypothetical protein VGH33_19715 [Isosphaeraceae bacterium]|jgi:hypothetical protein
MTLRLAPALALAIALALPGCDDAPPPPTPGVSSSPAPARPAPPPEPAKAELKPREILGKRTTDIRDAQKEMNSGSAVKAAPRKLGKDPITISGNAYVSIVGQSAVLTIKHDLDLYQAGHDGQYPKTYKEFMDEIIKPNNIALPTLPYYQEYGYDAPNHQLIILEYPH